MCCSVTSPPLPSTSFSTFSTGCTDSTMRYETEYEKGGRSTTDDTEAGKFKCFLWGASSTADLIYVLFSFTAASPEELEMKLKEWMKLFGRYWRCTHTRHTTTIPCNAFKFFKIWYTLFVCYCIHALYQNVISNQWYSAVLLLSEWGCLLCGLY